MRTHKSMLLLQKGFYDKYTIKSEIPQHITETFANTCS